jgi:hypothetical protein
MSGGFFMICSWLIYLVGKLKIVFKIIATDNIAAPDERLDMQI